MKAFFKKEWDQYFLTNKWLNFLTKGLTRKSVITARLLFHTLMWTAGYLIAIGITYLYTMYYWEQSIVKQLPLALLGIYLLSLLFINITFLGNTITNSVMGGLGLSGLVLMALVFVKTYSNTNWNPFVLFSGLDERLMNDVSFSYSEPFMMIGGVLVLCVVFSIVHFNRRAI